MDHLGQCISELPGRVLGSRNGRLIRPLGRWRNPSLGRTVATGTGDLTLEEKKMDQPRSKENARDAADQAGKAANEAAQRVGAQVQPALDQGKSMVQDLANQASEAGKQAVDRAGEVLQNAAPQAKEVASNLYERGSQSGEYVRQYAVEQPLTALLIAGAIGYGLGYLIHRR
jgi:ElaB/YqjD/DUF883 family membrane-anchored ribosome-binding protein